LKSQADRDETDWENLSKNGKTIVDALIHRLPDELRREALRIGYELHPRCPDGSDTLGEYGRAADQIILYLEAIREHCEQEGHDFLAEVETTYLHELGHHLGLDEGALEQRGL
jgi:hypothetical protein